MITHLITIVLGKVYKSHPKMSTELLMYIVCILISSEGCPVF